MPPMSAALPTGPGHSGPAPTNQLATNLPFLRRYARAATGSRKAGDALVCATLETALADPAALDRMASSATGLFAAPALFAPRCRLCGCEFASYELGPRGLYVVIAPLIIGLVCAALWLDETLRPPLWLHALIWPPLVAAVVVGAMRLAKVAWLKSRINREAE